MQRRSFLKTVGAAGLAAGVRPAWGMPNAANPQNADTGSSDTKTASEQSPEKILLKDYRPKSLHKVPITEISKAKFPIIDMHSHAYAETSEEIANWGRNRDEVGMEQH